MTPFAILWGSIWECLHERSGSLLEHIELLHRHPTHLGSSCEESLMAKISFCLNAALSSKPSFASAETSSPSFVSARGFTCACTAKLPCMEIQFW